MNLRSGIEDFRTQIDEPILKVYQYGSIVYGCTTPQSDTDYIVVVDFDKPLKYNVREDDADYTVYSEVSFIEKIREHEISVLECIFQNEDDKYLKYFKYNSEKLRRVISAISSNSFVKCKKKLKDGEDYTAKKSMFHSLRILMFGVQIAQNERITNYGEANELLPKIMNMKTWEEINFVCKPIFNELKSKFKTLAKLESEKIVEINKKTSL